MALRIRGLTNSTSTLNRSTITFLHQLGYASKSHWSKYLGGTPVNDSLLGIKYVLANEKNSQPLYYENAGGSVTTYGGTEYTYYRNPYALSIAYGASDALLDFDLSDGYNPFVRLNGLYGAILGDDEAPEIFKAISFGSDGIETTNCDVSTIAGHYKYAPQSSSTDCIVSYTITAAEDGEIFFYLPSEYPREVSIRVNGKKPGDSDTFYGGESDRIVSLGTFEKGDTIKLSMTLKGDVLYVKQNVDMFYYIDMDVFEGAISRIAENQMTVSEGWTDSYLPGTLTTTKDSQLIMTTLAYDSGWKVTVDGKRVDTVEALDGVVAFTVDTSGEHEIVMKYRPTALTLGLTITVLSIILFALIMIFEKQLKAVLARVCADGNTDSSETNEGTDDSDPEVDEYLLADIPDEADGTADPDEANSDEESEN